MVYVVNGVLANGVDMVLEKDFAGFVLQEMEIHPLMLLIRTLSMILQTFLPTLHKPSTNHTRDDMIESKNELLQSLGEILRQREQATNLSTYTPEPSRHFNYICYDDNDDDDDDESTIHLNEIIS
ncbi:hypothetical protein Tco_1435942 [Tanacetum coccineum]